MAATTLTNSFKVELLQGGHCFNATLSSLAGAGASGAYTLTGLSSTAGIGVGAIAGGTGVGAGAVVSRITSASAVQLDTPNSGTVTSGTISFAGDAFKGLLIKAAPSQTYSSMGATMTNVGTPGSGTPSTSNVGTDEMTNTSGTAYTSGGVSLTNITPALSSTTAVTSFSANPSWTSASFTASGMMVYNTSTRLGGAAAPLNNRTVGYYDFGGSQTVSSGTFTVLLPSNVAGTALIQLS